MDSPMKIILKKATVNDVETYIDIESSIGITKTYSAIIDPKAVKKELEETITYFIEYEGKIVGSLAYEIKGESHAYFSGFVVRPEFQRKGIAREAFNQLLAGELKDMKRVDLVTHPHNTPAIMLYLSLGFIIESWKDNYFGDGEPRIFMARVK